MSDVVEEIPGAEKIKVVFEGDSLSQFMEFVHYDFVYRFLYDINIADEIYTLIKDIDRNGAAKGMGKPERLKYFDGWSRRITDEHRLVYSVDDNKIIHIISCEGQYE